MNRIKNNPYDRTLVLLAHITALVAIIYFSADMMSFTGEPRDLSPDTLLFNRAVILSLALMQIIWFKWVGNLLESDSTLQSFISYIQIAIGLTQFVYLLQVLYTYNPYRLYLLFGVVGVIIILGIFIKGRLHERHNRVNNQQVKVIKDESQQ